MTRKYLFKALGPDGKEASDYVVADNMGDARLRLEATGHRDITVLDDEISAELRELAERSGVESDARVDLLSRYNPTPLALVSVALRKNSLWYAIGLLIVVATGLYWSMAAAGVSLLLLLAAILFPGWVQHQQNAIHLEFWKGRFDRSEKIARRLRGMSIAQAVPTILLELDSRIANARVMQKDFAGGVAVLAPWADSKAVGATTYRTKLAHLHYLSRDWAGYVRIQEEILEASGNAAPARIDVGQLLARVGNDDTRAAALLDGFDLAALPPLYVAFIRWGRGVLALKQGRNAEALADLTHAVDAMQGQAAHPHAWGALSLVTAYLCVAMARTGRADAARELFATVRPIVSFYGEDRLLAWLREEGLY
jgi:hypothetical protein